MCLKNKILFSLIKEMTSWIRTPLRKQMIKINNNNSIINKDGIEPIKIIIGICTYPRDGKTTYGLLKNTYSSLMNNYDNISNLEIKFILVGDDYSNINELENIFDKQNVSIFNVNIDNALRNKNVPKEVKWMHAVTRSIIFLFEKALEFNYDYILLSADDEIYINSALKTNIDYIRKYNYPDFVFSRGRHPNNNIYPININYSNLLLNYPEAENCIESGTLYKLNNKNFINDIILFRKSQWNNISSFIKNGDMDYKKYNIKPEDAELWEYLNFFFKNNKYSSLLIPIILIDHITEQTIYNYLD